MTWRELRERPPGVRGIEQLEQDVCLGVSLLLPERVGGGGGERRDV